MEKFIVVVLVLLLSITLIDGKVCNVLDYGAVADNKTDVGPAINKAYLACGKGSDGDGKILIPEGYYLMNSSLQMGYSDYVVQIDGIISLAFNPSLGAATLFSFNKCHNITLTGKGKILGYGDLWRPNGDLELYGRPRFVRFETCNNCKVTNLTFINSPSFHVIISGNHNEVAYITVDADNIGTTDGIDINGDFNYVHDSYIKNGDECISIKAGKYFFAERITCVNGGGCNIGSFGDGGTSNVEHAYFRDVTSINGGGAFIKAYPNTNGFIRNITYENFNITNIPYPISINTYWCTGECLEGGNLAISDFYFKNFKGTSASKSRPAVRLNCLPNYGCYNINFYDVNITAPDGLASDSIKNACGNGRAGLPDCKNSTLSTAAASTLAASTTASASASAAANTATGSVYPSSTTVRGASPDTDSSAEPSLIYTCTLLSMFLAVLLCF